MLQPSCFFLFFVFAYIIWHMFVHLSVLLLTVTVKLQIRSLKFDLCTSDMLLQGCWSTLYSYFMYVSVTVKTVDRGIGYDF